MFISRKVGEFKSFTFSPEESEVLANVLWTAIDWETYEHGDFSDFFEKFHQELMDQAP